MSVTSIPVDFVGYDIAIMGSGYAGLMAALRLARPAWQLRIALINARDQFIERVRLQESIIEATAPRIPSISTFVAGIAIDFICGRVTALDPTRRRIEIATQNQQREISFDQAIYALGSTIDVHHVPGAAEHAYRLEPGDGSRSAAALRSLLRESAGKPIRVVTVGGAETSIEVAGEIKTAWPKAEVILVSRSRSGDFRGARVERAVRDALKRLKVELIDCTTVAEVRPKEIITDKGRSIGCDICVWSGGLHASTVAGEAGLATDRQGRLWIDGNLRSISHPHILAVGDAAHPIAPTGAPYRLSAFAALTSGAHAADVIATRRAQESLPPFSFSTLGQGIAIGRGGVGFFSYPDDRQRLFIVKGRLARYARNFFVWFIVMVLKLERRVPGLFLWPGRKRISWQEAKQATQKVHPA